MGYIFWALFFLFFNLNIEAVGFNLLPEFIGWILVFIGCLRLSVESTHYEKARIFAIILAAGGLYSFIVSFFDTGEGFEDINFVISIVMMVLQAFAVHHIVEGLADIEKKDKCELNSSKIRGFWIAQIVLSYGSFFLGYVDITISLIATIASFIAGIIVIVFWSKTDKAYRILCSSRR